MAEKKELPDLEEIAKKLTTIEEDFKIPEIEPRVTDAYINIAKYTDSKGRVRYKHNFSEEPEKVKELSDTIFDALVEHIHLLEYDMEPGKLKELREFKNPSGISYTDFHAHLALGLSRDDLRKRLEDMKNDLTLSNILEVIMKQVKESYIPIKTREILSPLEEKHTEDIKDYITKKADKHELPEYKDKIKDKRTLQEVLPIYGNLAQDIYGKKLKS